MEQEIQETVSKVEKSTDESVREYQRFRRYISKKKVDPSDILRAFNEVCNKLAPSATTNIQVFETGVGDAIDQLLSSEDIEGRTHYLLFKAVLHLIKVFEKRACRAPLEAILPRLNKWQELFWDSSASQEECRNMFIEIKKSAEPLYHVKIRGKDIHFTSHEEKDYDKQFSENMDKLLDNKTFKGLSDYEKWSTTYTLKDLSKCPDEHEETLGQKLALALKRSSLVLHDIVEIKHTKRHHSEKTMIAAIRSIFDCHNPTSAGYPLEIREDINKLLEIFSKSYDKSSSIKEVVKILLKIEEFVPSTILNPNIRRNFIGFVYSVIENILKQHPEEFFDEFFEFLKLAANDLRVQAEESITENDPLFLENYQRCYLNIPTMVLLYSEQPEYLARIVEVFANDFKNAKLSIFQLHVMFSSLSMVARSKNMESQKTNFFSIDISAKKYSLTVCVDGTLQNESNSIIIELRRAIDTNTISFEIRGKHSKKYKVDDSVNKTYIRSLLDTKQGANREGIHTWKVLDASKNPEAVLYTQIALYSILKDSIDNEKHDKKNYICDTLLNLSIVNSPTIAKHAVSVLVEAALRSSNFFQNTLFARLCKKMTEFEEVFHSAEREKSSDFLIHPHKVKNIRRLINRSLIGDNINWFSKTIYKGQESSLEPKALMQLLVSINSPAVYNFNEGGSRKYKVIKRYLDDIQKHYQNHSIDFKDILAKISEPLVARLSTRMFMFSDRAHMRVICENVCGSLSSISQEFYDLVSQTFKLSTTIEQIKKCLKCKEMFREQYSHITFYDMNHVADSAEALLKVFENKMKSIEASNPEPEIEEEEEKLVPEIKAAPKNLKDMNMLLLGAGKKKAKKGTKAKKDTKAVVKKEKSVDTKSKVVAQPEKPAVEENKEDRMKRDLRTVNTFLHYTFTKACTYITSICNIYELASKGKSDELLDKIIYQNIHIFIELLRYPACNFIIKSKLPKLLENNSGENRILRIRECLIECLLLSARLLNNMNTTKEEVDKQFKVFFRIISEDDLDFSKLGKGLIRLILTNINFAIKHSEISHTYKENAVSIAHKILKSSQLYCSVDMLRVGQTLLKQDYVSKCGYKFLSALFTQINDEERLVLCSKLFSYHSLQLPSFFKVVFDFNQQLPRSETFEVQLWIMQFEEEPINKLAQQVWNKYYSNIDVIEKGRDKRNRIMNFAQYALDKFGAVNKSASDAFVAAINIDSDLLYEYIEGIRDIIQGCHTQSQADEQLRFFSSVVNSVSNLINESQLEKLFEFIIYEGYLHSSPEISASFEKCGTSVCIEQGRQHSVKILKILKYYLLNPLNKRTDIDTEKEQLVLNECLVLIASLAKHFDHSNEATLDIYERIIEMLNIPNKELKKSISKCISPLAKLLEDKSKKFLKQLIAMLLKSKDLSTLTGAAFAIAGIVKGFGLRTIDEYEILDTLEKEANSKQATHYKKVALLNCYEAFATILGKTFELYLERVVPQVLSSFSDSKDIVRNAGKKALDAIMLNISGYCVKKIISSIFLHGIEEANWRTKLGQIEALCSMAMFAPNQVAVHLPQVISSIRAILLDTHPKVQEAGQDALNKITSAMRNQGRLNALAILEVHSEQIAKSSATENLQKALNHLLDTTFMHSLDEPSLALLMPLIKDGLEAVNRKIQIKALRIIGHICSIVADTTILLPYIKDIAPIMVNLLLTVHPKLRSASCKALAGLVKGIGINKCLGMCRWVCKQLKTASVSDTKNIHFVYQEIDCEGKSAEDTLKEEMESIHKL